MIFRNVTGPKADGALCVAVTVDEAADEQIAQATLERGKERIDDLKAEDPRFAELLDRYERRWEVVADYGMGTVRLGVASSDGNLEWHR